MKCSAAGAFRKPGAVEIPAKWVRTAKHIGPAGFEPTTCRRGDRTKGPTYLARLFHVRI